MAVAPSAPVPIKAASAHLVPYQVDIDKEETPEEYCVGGYHPLSIGDELNNRRYKVRRKLGWGHFSTVWLVKDQTANVHVALKVVKSSPKYSQTARDEIALLKHVASAPNKSHDGRKHIVSFLDAFEIPAEEDQDGRRASDLRHVCMTFEPLGENLLSLLRRLQTVTRRQLKKGVPRVLVRQITRQMLQALDFLHMDCGLIHTDLKPENVLVAIDDVEDLVRACATSEQLTGISPTTANRIVPIPRTSGSRRTASRGSRSVQIYGSYPLPNPMQDWGRRNAGPEVESLSVIMSQLAVESQAAAALTAHTLKTRDVGVNTDDIDESMATSSQTDSGSGVPSGASSFVSEASIRMPSSGTASPSTAPTSLEGSMIFQADAFKIPTQLLSASVPTIRDSTSCHSDHTLHLPPGSTDDLASTPLAPSTPQPVLQRASQSYVDVGHTSFTRSSAPLVSESATASLITATAPPSNPASFTPVPSTPASVPRGRPTFDPAPVNPTPPTSAPPRIRIKIADMGNATPINRHFTADIQTRQYRCPEVILGYKDWNETADIWSVACMVFELLTSDYLFAPKATNDFTKDDDHVAQIIELLGDLPENRKQGGRFSTSIFRRNGRLRKIAKLRDWPLDRVMMEKYDMEEEDALALCDFLWPMLDLDPAARASAGDMSRHPWLDRMDDYPTLKKRAVPKPVQPEVLEPVES